MKELPLWLKVVGGVVVFAIFVAASQILLWLDKMGTPKVGLD